MHFLDFQFRECQIVSLNNPKTSQHNINQQFAQFKMMACKNLNHLEDMQD